MLRRALVPFSLLTAALAGIAAAALVTPRARAQEAPPATAPTTTVPATTLVGTTAPPPAATTTAPAAGTTTAPAATTGTTASTATATTAATTTGATTTAPAATTTAPTVTVPSTTSTSSAPTTLVVTGRGWGHGVGMGQWGAYGYARHGWTYDRILKHYYRDTRIARRPSPTVRVLLQEGKRRAVIGSDAAYSVTDARGTTVQLEPGRLPVGVGLVVGEQTLVSPLTFTPGDEPLTVAGKPYRGRVLVLSNGKTLQVVNALGLEDYVKGVVAYEVPASWPIEAVKAQAVAARSYALAGLTTVVTARAFDLYADTRSQMYGGIEAEDPAVTKAVEATARRVVVYRGKVATTYYSSTTGGRTVSAAEAWGKPVPYLVSVPDPYDRLSPYHTWGPVLFDARKVAKALKLEGPLLELDPVRGPTGRVREVTAVGPEGEVTVTGSELRTLLGLRSSWFSVGWLALERPAKVAYGRVVRLTGTVRGVDGVELEARALHGSWETVKTIEPADDGSFAIRLRPRETTLYRLAAEGLRGALVKVPVGPVVEAAVAPAEVKGTVRPPVPNAAVQVQRQDGRRWSTVATATTDDRGAFSVAGPLEPGSYRVRCAPGRGLAPGFSPMLAVQ